MKWKTRDFILKFMGIFLCRETSLNAHRMKSCEKPFFVKIMQFFWEKWYIMWLKGIFLNVLSDFRIFLIADSLFQFLFFFKSKTNTYQVMVTKCNVCVLQCSENKHGLIIIYLVLQMGFFTVYLYILSAGDTEIGRK